MLAHKRLQKELVALTKEPPQYIRARPLEDDILKFHYVLEGAPGTPYEGGFYHGILKFPSEYPLKPPAVMMYTPNGRFATGQRLCLSMSDFHPESWNPVWSVATILVGLQSFMNGSEVTAGSIETSLEQKRAYASASLRWNTTNSKEFRKLFPELVAIDDARKKAEEAAAAATASMAGLSLSSQGAPGADSAAAAGGQAAAHQQPSSAFSSCLILLGLLAALIVVALQKHRSAAASSGSEGSSLSEL